MKKNFEQPIILLENLQAEEPIMTAPGWDQAGWDFGNPASYNIT